MKLLDERDVLAACERHLISPGRFMRDVRMAQLEREYETMRLGVDRLIEKLDTVTGHEYLAVSDQIDQLWAKMDRNSDERFEKRSSPSDTSKAGDR